jgi:hypothetical protein
MTSAETWAKARASIERASAPPPLYDPDFLEQRAFIEDAGNMLVALCTRRAGKSFGAALRLIRAGYRHPGSNCLFLALTRMSAKGILWDDVLKVINRKWNLGATFNESELRMTLPNGSRIYLLGADANEDEREKLLGKKYAEVDIDESASYSIDFEHLVFGTLKPAVADYRGNVVLIGTPSNIKSGLFYDLTEGQNPREPGRWTKNGWSGHRWSAFQNPHMARQWQQEIDELIANNPLIEQTPAFQQNYFGQWCIDDTALVYRYVAGRNDFSQLPAYGRAGSWHFVMGIDLGFEDASSFTVAAYHDFDRALYVVESSKQSGLDITGVAEYAAAIRKRHAIEQTVIDGANKQAVQELNNRHGLEAVPADKRGKAEFVDIMNAEFIQGRIKLSVNCEPLKQEYAALVWDERAMKKGKRLEHAGCENHAADSTLYAWRYCWQYLADAAPAVPAPVNSPEWREQVVAADVAREEERIQAMFAANAEREREEREGW